MGSSGGIDVDYRVFACSLVCNKVLMVMRKSKLGPFNVFIWKHQRALGAPGIAGARTDRRDPRRKWAEMRRVAGIAAIRFNAR